MSHYTKPPASDQLQWKISHERTRKSNATQTQMEEDATRIRDAQQNTSNARHDANKHAQTDDVSSCTQVKCLICDDDEKQTTRGSRTCRNGHSLCECCHNDYVLRDDTNTAHCPLCPTDVTACH